MNIIYYSMARLCRLACLALAGAGLLQLSGCASLAEGVTRALVERPKEEEKDTRQCYVTGRAFPGISSYLDTGAVPHNSRKTLKVLMVHGIGTHEPGYATRLAENLAQAMDLGVRGERFKTLHLHQPQQFPGEDLGQIRVTRYTDKAEGREMVFYELTWSGITEPEKALLEYDNSGEHTFRRANLNNTMKGFANTHIPDPLIYLGKSQEKIQTSVGQSLCWLFSRDWEELAEETDEFCNPTQKGYLEHLDDHYAFLSHSLGSRVLTDSLQRVVEHTAKYAATSASLRRALDTIRQKEFPVYMLSNQLLLLQLGYETPKVTGQFKAYCEAGGERQNERAFKRLNVVAFSDPNDLLSYAVPPDFLDKYMDSRLCPTMVNVSINVAKVTDLFGLGQVANPMSAHTEYDNDERVIALITRGIGTPQAAPIVKERCVWTETR